MTDRKKAHIELAYNSQTDKILKDTRFIYEPFTSVYKPKLEAIVFLGKQLNAPVWISSMTGGTKIAKKINYNLATLAAEFGLGMGLGSCRNIIESNNIDDFNVRHIIGAELPLYANIGINQVENLLFDKRIDLISELIDKLNADGIIIHINPLQEFFQPEGEMLKNSPKTIVEEFLKHFNHKIIIKEVGQGMGYDSLKSLLQLPIDAIELAAFGGTNFTKLELLRNSLKYHKSFEKFMNVGHTIEEMITDLNQLFLELPECRSKEIIISGGIKDFLDGYYFINKTKFNAIYGQASTFLHYAQESYEVLKAFFTSQIEGYKLANSYLHVV